LTNTISPLIREALLPNRLASHHGLAAYRTGYPASPTHLDCADMSQALLLIFKRRIAEGKDKDTALELCEVELQAKPDQTKCRLVIRMLCRHGVVKTYRLTYESAEVLHASFDKARSQNYWTVSSRTVRDVVEYFGPKTEQLDWYFEKGKVTFTSYTEKVQHGRGEISEP
jgi:cell cycle checkpoint control protein RAD9A